MHRKFGAASQLTTGCLPNNRRVTSEYAKRRPHSGTVLGRRLLGTALQTPVQAAVELCCCRCYEREFQVDDNLVADKDAAGLKHRVPGQAEVLAADGGFAGDACAGVAEGIHCDAVEFGFDGNFLGDSLDGEIAHKIEAVAVCLDMAGYEGDLRVLLHIEEVLSLDVAVAVDVAGVKAGRPDGCGDLRVGQRLANFEGGVGVLEHAADLADTCMADGEADLAVGSVEGPDAGGDVGGKGHHDVAPVCSGRYRLLARPTG